MIKITVLGSGSSQGIPIIGCNCIACMSTDPKDKRLRSSIYMQCENESMLVDCGPDFRHQALSAQISTIDKLLITHEHNDHIIGLDDLRPLLFHKKRKLRIYALGRVNQAIRTRFAYAFAKKSYVGVPTFDLKTVQFGDTIPFGGEYVELLEVRHGKLPIIGFKLGRFAYITDAKSIPDETKKRLYDLDLLIINALQRGFHRSHLNLEEAIGMIETLQPKQARFIHISHTMGLHEKINQELPSNIKLTFDQEKFILENK